MRRVSEAWRAMRPEQRVAAFAAVGLLLTMFFPWYGLQSLNRRTGAIYSHTINAFGDVSFVEAAIFLVAAGVCAMLFGRAEGREFRVPGGDGTIVSVAGGWAALLIFYRVFDRPSGHGYPVGIEWGFFLAFVAAGTLAYAGWRMRGTELPTPPARARTRDRHPSHIDPPGREAAARDLGSAGRARDAHEPPLPRPRYPPAPAVPPGARPRASAAPARRHAAEQLSFEDPPPHAE